MAPGVEEESTVTQERKLFQEKDPRLGKETGSVLYQKRGIGLTLGLISHSY